MKKTAINTKRQQPSLPPTVKRMASGGATRGRTAPGAQPKANPVSASPVPLAECLAPDVLSEPSETEHSATHEGSLATTPLAEKAPTVPELDEIPPESPAPTTSTPTETPRVAPAGTGTPASAALLRVRAQLRAAAEADARASASTVEEALPGDAGDDSIYCGSGTPPGVCLNDIPKAANEILLRTRAEIERSGNLKREIKEAVCAGLQALYEMILSLADSRAHHITKYFREQAAIMRTRVVEDAARIASLHRLREAQERELAALASVQGEVLKEVKATRLLVVHDVLEELRHTREDAEGKLRTSTACNASALAEVSSRLETVSAQLHASTDVAALGALSSRLQTMENKLDVVCARPVDPTDLPNFARLASTIDEIKAAAQPRCDNQHFIKEVCAAVTAVVKPSYAEIAARPVEHRDAPAEYRPAYSLIISSTNRQDTSEEVMRRVSGAVDARRGGVRVDRARKTKDQKVVLTCPSMDDVAEVKKRLISGGNVRVEEARPRNPLVVVRDVMASYEDADIIQYLKAQNRHVVDGLSEEHLKMAVRFRKPARNPLQRHVVLEVSGPLWRRLTEVGHIHLNIQRLRVHDHSPLVQCLRCLGYGHTRRHCDEHTDSCSHCAGPHHIKECKKREEAPKCINCVSTKNEPCHNAFSSVCPVRQKWDNIARSRVMYC